VKFENILLAVLFLFLILGGVKTFLCLKAETGWLELENATIPEGCYLEKKGNTYKVRARICEIDEGNLDILCPNGNELLLFHTHGRFRKGNVEYTF